METKTVTVNAEKEVIKSVAKNRNSDIREVAIKGVLTIFSKLKLTWLLAIRIVTMDEVAMIPVA